MNQYDTMALTSAILPLIQTSYWILFLAMLLDGPLATMIAGGACAGGFLKFWVCYAVILAGDQAADNLYYALGRFGREQLIERWGKYIGLTVKRVARLEHRFENHGAKLLAAGKLTHGIGGALMVAAGTARMPWVPFILVNIATAVPKSLAFLLLGYYFGSLIARANNILNYVAVATVALAVVGAITYITVRQFKDEEG